MTTQPATNTTEPAAANAAELTPAAAWSRRVRRIGGFIQTAFATFWLIRASLTAGGRAGDVLLAASGVAVTSVLAYALRNTAGTAPRPTGPQASQIGRSVTAATIFQLAASFVLPVIVTVAGHPGWVLPSIVITIGPLLLWLEPRGRYPPLPPGRLGDDRRTGHPGRHDAGPGARPDHGHCRRRPAPGHRRRRLPRPREPPARPPVRLSPAPCEGPMIMPRADSPATGFRPFFTPS